MIRIIAKNQQMLEEVIEFLNKYHIKLEFSIDFEKLQITLDSTLYFVNNIIRNVFKEEDVILKEFIPFYVSPGIEKGEFLSLIKREAQKIIDLKESEIFYPVSKENIYNFCFNKKLLPECEKIEYLFFTHNYDDVVNCIIHSVGLILNPNYIELKFIYSNCYGICGINTNFYTYKWKKIPKNKIKNPRIYNITKKLCEQYSINNFELIYYHVYNWIVNSNEKSKKKLLQHGRIHTSQKAH